MNVSGNSSISVNNAYRTESANTNSLKSESAALTNIKKCKKRTCSFQEKHYFSRNVRSDSAKSNRCQKFPKAGDSRF